MYGNLTIFSNIALSGGYRFISARVAGNLYVNPGLCDGSTGKQNGGRE